MHPSMLIGLTIAVRQNDPLPGRDWAVETVHVYPRDRDFPFRVRGWNRCTGEPFDWRVPSLSNGYDLTQAFYRLAADAYPSPHGWGSVG